MIKKKEVIIHIKSLCAIINTRGANTQAKHVFKMGNFQNILFKNHFNECHKMFNAKLFLLTQSNTKKEYFMKDILI